MLVGVTGLLMLATSVPAFAADEPTAGTSRVAPPMVADDAPVVPGSVTDNPSAGAVTGSDSSAALEEDAPIPGETEEVIDATDPVFPGKPGSDQPNGPICDREQFVRVTKNTKNTMAVKYKTFVKNDLSYAVDFKFTSKKSGTTTMGMSVTVSGEVKVLWLGKLKVDVNGNVSKSWTSELGIETGGKVKAHSTVNGDYGIMKENAYGYVATRYSNCQLSDKQYMNVWAPYKEGWRLSS
ncbi:hypothetical protein [Streptomyces sp. AS02]|uniref:hypothetical protein n=1 Tax=Streptomyces sp. AS02 TaxID=2938946 RepID=UPI002020BA62|nr:hypothetical protein [Streptomyces sp. AS02]MCL8014619.1 hypothetical protein [Streptomyces sp. AS02]